MSGGKIKAFLDASTIISGLLFQGNEATLLELSRIGAITLVTNQYVIEEVTRVLRRAEFNFTSDEVNGLIKYMHTCLTVNENPTKETIQENLDLLTDKKDTPVALGAAQSKADYLVTGDKELQNNPKIQAITTRNLLKQILPIT